MKKILLGFFRFFIIIVILFIFAIGCFIITRKIQLHYSYSKIYASQEDKELAVLIENMIKKIYYLKNEEKQNNKEYLLNDMKLSMELNNIEYVCYSPSMYTYKAKESLENVGIYYKYANLLDLRKKCEYGKKSTTLILFVKNNEEIIPIFTSFHFYDFNTKIDFLNVENQTDCVKVPNKKVKLNIDDSLKDKASLQIEFL